MVDTTLPKMISMSNHSKDSLSGDNDSHHSMDGSSSGGPTNSSSHGTNSKIYKYHDYGAVDDEDDLLHLANSCGNSTDGESDYPPVAPPVPSRATSTGSAESSSIRVQKFPVKLYAILAQKEFHDIITWMPHGRSWKVLKPSMFESLVMPLFFEYSNYHSFNRLVNAWSFRRISSGPDRGSYYHELFLRGKPQLQKYMRRLPKTHKKLPMKKGDEPDFYKMDQENPLPALEDAPIPGVTSMSANNNGGPPSSLIIKTNAAQHSQQMLNQQSLLGTGCMGAGVSCSREPQIVTPPHFLDMPSSRSLGAGLGAGSNGSPEQMQHHSSMQQMMQQQQQQQNGYSSYQQNMYGSFGAGDSSMSNPSSGLQQLQQQQFSTSPFGGLGDDYNDSGACNSNLMLSRSAGMGSSGLAGRMQMRPQTVLGASPMRSLVHGSSTLSPLQDDLSSVMDPSMMDNLGGGCSSSDYYPFAGSIQSQGLGNPMYGSAGCPSTYGSTAFQQQQQQMRMFEQQQQQEQQLQSRYQAMSGLNGSGGMGSSGGGNGMNSTSGMGFGLNDFDDYGPSTTAMMMQPPKHCAMAAAAAAQQYHHRF